MINPVELMVERPRNSSMPAITSFIAFNQHDTRNPSALCVGEPVPSNSPNLSISSGYSACPANLLRRTEPPMSSNSIDGKSGAACTAADPLADLIAGCRRRESGAEREMVRQTQDRVFRTVSRMVGPQDAEDVTQQVFLQVFRQISQFSGQSTFATWLYRVAVNESLQHLRGRRAKRPNQLTMEPTDPAPSREQQVEERELLDRALALIDPELRVTFVLREVDGLTYEQIAKAMQVPAGTVASRLSRAREELQDHLRRMGWNA